MAGDENDRGAETLFAINPAVRYEDTAIAEKYKIEPYVLAGDVYTNPFHAGRGGWSWYTGSAAWLYLVMLEDLLGFTVKNSEKDGAAELALNPSVPPEWNEYTIEYQYKTSTYVITVRRSKEKEKHEDEPYVVKLLNDGKRHEVLIPINFPE